MAEHADPHADPHADATEHRHERPQDWGWHAEFGRWARVAGWLAAIVLCLFNVTTYYNTSQAPWLYGIVAAIVFLLVRDRFKRRNAWRE